MRKIMFSAGEASGDMHGAGLAKALLAIDNNIELIGFGGPQMEEAGVRLCRDMRDYSVMGFGEVILNLRKMFKLKDCLVQFMKEEKPDILVIIDYPDFNWPLAKAAKELGIPVFSYIPPTAWAWRKDRAKKCAKIADQIAAIFPFETKVYEDAGAKITYVGNPLVEKVHTTMSDEEAKQYFQIDPGKKQILLLPGSRKQEIVNILPMMLEAAAKLYSAHSDLQFHLPVAVSLDEDVIKNYVERYNLPIFIHRDKIYDLMGQCQVAIATSGTVTLEAALMGLPTVVVYRMSKFTYCLAKLFVKLEYFSLPNILLQKCVFPELLQNQVNPDRIFELVEEFLQNDDKRRQCLKDLAELKTILGSGEVARTTAELILATIPAGGGIPKGN